MSTSIKEIFLADGNWEGFEDKYHFVVRPVEREEVEKMLGCRDFARGHASYECPRCG